MARKGENIFKRKDGRWEARYIKGYDNGKAVYGYLFGHSYTEAKAKKAAAMAAPGVTKQKNTPQQPLFVDVAKVWLEGLKPIRKTSTIVKYISQLDNHISPYFKGKRIDEVTNEDLIAFGNDLLTQDLSAKTVSDILSRVKSIRRYAIIHGYEVKFIPDCISIPQHTDEIRVFTVSEESRLLDYIRRTSDLTSLGILISLSTGIRIGELCALTWDDISLTEQELHVRRTMQRLKNTDKNAKTKTYINIDTPTSCFDADRQRWV